MRCLLLFLLILLSPFLLPVLPNGAVTGLDIGFSNASLVHITMSFYTMCKSTTPIFLLAFAFIWRLET
jgi:solute carrier family 35 protein C2